VTRDVYNAANHMAASRAYGSKPLPVLSVIDGGLLKGYVPVDKDWKGFSTEDYKAACESVDQQEETVLPTGKRLNMQGFQIVRSQFFPSSDDLNLTISQGNLRFNTACLRKFEDVEYVELLLNTVKNCIAIRPCSADNPNAIHWGRLRYIKDIKEGRTQEVRGKVLNISDEPVYKDNRLLFYEVTLMDEKDGVERLLLFDDNIGKPPFEVGSDYHFRTHQNYIIQAEQN
jgi:site-specific DNA recombinase